MFGLVDCNNFYASCERVFRPDLKGKPIAVLSNNDGCIIARSEEVKALSIPMGAPAHEFKKKFTENNVYVFSSNYALYGDMSNRVMSLLGTMAPQIEVYSIDEAFLDFKGCDYLDLHKHGLHIVKTIKQFTGIPVSVGIAETKALAKTANKIAKKFPNETNNAYIIDTEEKRIKALKWLKIEDVWGIGRHHTKRLIAMNINNAYKFTQLPDEWVRKNMSVVGLRLKHELEGKPTLDMEPTKDKKNIATTRSFDVNYRDFEQLRERISTFAVTCAEKLRRQKSCCNALMVFIHTNGFREDLDQYSQNIIVKLPFPTNSSIEIVKFAVEGLKLIFKHGYRYKKAGVILMEFTPENAVQIAMDFDPKKEEKIKIVANSNPKHKAIMDAMDKINVSIGQKKVKLASQALDRTWKMKQERLSPRYTTKFDEILTVYI